MSAYEVDDIAAAAATLPRTLEDIFNAANNQVCVTIILVTILSVTIGVLTERMKTSTKLYYNVIMFFI